MTGAVVLGGGFAGVLAAAVLAEHVDEVVLVEAGQYPAAPTPRQGLPQAHHSHILVSGGAQALETLLPGTLAALYEHGAHRRGLPSGALILTAEGWFRRQETDAFLVSGTRWLLDHVIRHRVLADGRITLRERTRVLGLAGDGSRISGAVVRRPDDRVETLAADLVVDATGRGSQALRWLADLGVPAIVEDTVDPGLAYATRAYQAPPGSAVPAVMLHPAAVRPARGATLFPIEGGRWIVTLTGTRGGEPPTDEAGFTSFAESLRCTLIADLMAAAEPLGGVRAFHGTVNRRRHFERAALPDGFLVLGDGLVAVNPVHSHGMSVAALSALRLADELAERGADPSATSKLQAAVAEVAERSWQMAIAQDRQHAADAEAFVVPQPSRVAMTRRVLGSALLMTEFFRAQTLMSEPPPARADLFAELSKSPEPLLTAAEAIAQFPTLRRLGREP
jgi:2-polyprenyl-6-methoxyphenol hydroxylase-like FAD-dependent oxidoreductase